MALWFADSTLAVGLMFGLAAFAVIVADCASRSAACTGVAESYLVFKVLNQQNPAPGGNGAGMPVNGALTDAEKCMVINWVKGGAN
ncbi:hypothetical protein [Nannocystis pusilla]|uniref:Cytochrome c domain-containing protein n=1 Tax=Nannocystis pusilla TaxID=889268 RepID=A0ABS7TIV2_9BACT|nr:hypothetical protein [Nannocystis pusilla]MBZ5708155.1 hypothetical protein [Nannocystis pusilla]